MFFDVPIAESWAVDILSLLAYLLLHSTMPIVVAVVTAMAMMTTMMTLTRIAGDCSCVEKFDIAVLEEMAPATVTLEVEISGAGVVVAAIV